MAVYSVFPRIPLRFLKLRGIVYRVYIWYGGKKRESGEYRVFGAKFEEGVVNSCVSERYSSPLVRGITGKLRGKLTLRVSVAA